MGTTALADAKSALSLAIAHNMDSVTPLDSAQLATYMGMPKANAASDTFFDSSGSTSISYDQATNKITYHYQRGDVKLKGEIDLTTQQMEWTTSLTNADRVKALAQGLKIAPPTGAGPFTNTNAAVGQLGIDTGLTFPT